MSVVLTLALLFAGAGEDPGWPCWRGPQGDGVSRETGWLSVGAKEPAWRAQVGAGHSCVAIVPVGDGGEAGGLLVTLGFDPANGVDVVWCLDALTGEELWTFTYPATLDANGHGGGTHTTPAIAAGRVYLTNRRGEVRALELETGELAWEVDLRQAGVAPNDYGFGGSPVVRGARVYVNAARIFALDARTGATVWKTADHLALYSTPTVWGERLVSFTKEGLWVLERADGAELAHFPWRRKQTTVNASTPIVVDDRRIFLSSGYDHGCALVDFGADEPTSLWESKALRTRMTGCVLYADRLFGYDESTLKCVGLDGKERWRKRGLGTGAVTASDGRLITIGRMGELVVIDATRDRYTELARTRVFERAGVFWGPPALWAGRIYARSGQGELICLDQRAPD